MSIMVKETADKKYKCRICRRDILQGDINYTYDLDHYCESCIQECEQKGLSLFELELAKIKEHLDKITENGLTKDLAGYFFMKIFPQFSVQLNGKETIDMIAQSFYRKEAAPGRKDYFRSDYGLMFNIENMRGDKFLVNFYLKVIVQENDCEDFIEFIKEQEEKSNEPKQD